MISIQQLKMPISHSDNDLIAKVTKRLRIGKEQIKSWSIIRQSVDARRKPELFYVYTLEIEVENEAKTVKLLNDNNIMSTKRTTYQFPVMGERQLNTRPIVIGAGPAGLFCAYMLAKRGYRPLVLERGDEARVRQEKIEKFWQTGILDENSNVQFGEGGAGTFSDGKLNTSVKDALGRNRKVLEILVEAGAPSEILYQQKPHLGTDILIEIVEKLRTQIIAMGGEFCFQTQVTDLLIEKGKISKVRVNDKRDIAAEVVVCAIGHSARDTFSLLHKRNVTMAEKPFAVGLRIEHPQILINKSQYGQEDVPELGAAAYKLTHQCKNGRGIYSFCMCPGGYVVNASSARQGLVVNGMSYQSRSGQNANSALVVTISPDDYQSFDGVDVLRGISFQEQLEKQAYKLGNGKIPVQLYGDFKKKKKSESLGTITPSIKGEWELSDLNEILPNYISDSIVEGVEAFDKKIKGFSREDALLCGIESRTSSPVRILRDENLEGNVKGFYPCGEGAGYAGGITSAAIDGIKIAEIIQKNYKNLMEHL